MYNLIAQNKEDVGMLVMVRSILSPASGRQLMDGLKALETMYNWPLLTRNKVDSSKVPELVKELSAREGEAENLVSLRDTATKVIVFSPPL